MNGHVLFFFFIVVLLVYNSYRMVHVHDHPPRVIRKLIVVHCARDARPEEPNINALWWMSKVPHVHSTHVVDLADAPPLNSVDWTSTLVVLVLSPRDKECQQHPWYMESVRMRERARIVTHSFPQSWQGSLFVHSGTVLKRLHKRPLLLRFSGEVFSGPNREYCSPDIVLYKSKHFPIECTATLHYLEHMWQMHDGVFPKQALYDLAQPRHIKRRIPDRFCTIVSKSLSSHRYENIDHLMRWITAKQLSEYKPVISGSGMLDRTLIDYFLPQHRIVHNSTLCKSGELKSTTKCMDGFKFVISMENSAQPGYVSEKVIMAAMAGAIPIYFGAPNIAEYINMDRIVHCDVDSDARQFLHLTTKYGIYSQWDKQHVRDTRIPTMKKIVYKSLRKCIARVHYLDQNDTAWREVVSKPLFKNMDQLLQNDGGTTAYGFYTFFSALL